MNKIRQIWATIKPFIPNTLILAAILSAVWYINGRFEAGERAADARHAAIQQDIKIKQQELDTYIKTAAGKLVTEATTKIQQLDTNQVSTTTIIREEISKDPRLSDPEQGLSEDLFNAVNNARKETHDHD